MEALKPGANETVENIEQVHKGIVSLRDAKDMDKPTLRAALVEFEKTLKSVPKEFHVQLETMHHFTPGIYCRTVLMKRGEMIVGKIHKKEHVVIVSAGKCSVVSEEFGNVEITAPAIFKSPAFVKRALLIHEDCVWTTVHQNSTNTEDLSILEKELIADDYGDEGN